MSAMRNPTHTKAVTTCTINRKSVRNVLGGQKSRFDFALLAKALCVEGIATTLPTGFTVFK
jgi:hypothetical protein